MNKRELVEKIIRELEKQKQDVKKRYEATRQEVIDAPGAMQSHSDTSKYQLSILADKIKKSVLEKEQTIQALKQLLTSRLEEKFSVAEVDALVEVKNQNQEKIYYFIFPGGNGLETIFKGRKIIMVSQHTPVASALLGRKVGDRVNFRVGPTTKELEIVGIR
ncbi:MAG: GreA/GreB family elongation factor [Patescibacteria group bacterium]